MPDRRKRHTSREDRFEDAMDETRRYLRRDRTAEEEWADYIARRVAALARPPKPPRNARRKRTIVLSDIHFPKHDPDAWEVAKAAVRDLKPDGLWLLGDVLDISSLNRYGVSPGDEDLSPRVEYVAGLDGLDELDAVAGSAWDRMFFDGNHEWRVDRHRANSQDKAARDFMPSVQRALLLKERGYRYIGRKEQPFKVGDLHVLHGQWYNLHHPHKHLTALGVNCIYGHVHTPGTATTRNQNGSLSATCVPCLRLLDREWEHMRRIHTWTHGFAVIEWSGSRSHVYNVFIKDGHAAYGGFEWGAE